MKALRVCGMTVSARLADFQRAPARGDFFEFDGGFWRACRRRVYFGSLEGIYVSSVSWKKPRFSRASVCV